MREYLFASLILFFVPPVSAQVVPAGWQIIKDSRNVCQIAVPKDWVPYRENLGAAVFQDSSTAMAVVTSQPGQPFRPLPAGVLKALNLAAGKLFENSDTRIFYQDRTSTAQGDPNAYSFSVPSKTGTCSGHLTFVPSITEEVARKIALSLAPAGTGSSN